MEQAVEAAVDVSGEGGFRDAAGAWRDIDLTLAPAGDGTLHRLDAQALDWIAVEPPPDTPEWAGVLDRLRRASATIW